MRNRVVLLTVITLAFGAGRGSAAPLDPFFEATGTIGTVNDSTPPGLLSAISVGTPWTLDFTFDSATPGVPQPPCSTPSFMYPGAISSTKFVLGSFTYFNSGGDIFTNSDLPVIGCSTTLGGPGLVQFQWSGGWTGGAGGPDLNAGLLLASYNDLAAAGGALPLTTNRIAGGVLDGLEWDEAPFGEAAQFTAPFDPHAVPEPVSGVLLLSGLAGSALARRRRRFPRA